VPYAYVVSVAGVLLMLASAFMTIPKTRPPA
jgi:hypothetical protein